MTLPLRFVAALLASVILVAGEGCVSRSHARREAAIAFQAGQIQQQHPAPTPEQIRASILFRGNVRNALVRWQPQMTLSQAIVAAEFLGAQDPRSIVVTRNGQPVFVDVRRLLRGGDDREVFPGDIVELR
ncbi:MAG TPA: hypothetical protein DCM86_11340 [Verrucomicrobiales bacterium]|nr:hypothetical protein [Verrucomicrobiales bacterium]